ncbi:class II aldolase/adducin family protein [Gammaproteobacteria bacterium]|nr:class II aldolase/adducin family protein [Gammaproteobacteria bacterium]
MAIKIDTTKGRLPPKPKGLEMVECKTIEETRRQQLEKLTAGFRLFAYFGYDEGVAGHITVRDPEFSDHFWVNPIGLHFSQIKVSDLLLVNHDGEVVQGDRPVNVAAFAIHSRLHQARPDVNAAAHSHSMYGKTFSTFGKLLDPISQDSCAFYERQAIHNHFTGVVEETEEGDKIASALGDKTVLFMQNHGILTTGTSIDVALWFFFSLERCCQSQLMADAAGAATLIPHETAIKTREFIANDFAAWASFQPLYDMIAEKEPDLFD